MVQKSGGEYVRFFLANGRADGASGAPLTKSHGRLRVDDRCILSGIIFVNPNGSRWRGSPKEDGPYKTLYNRWKPRSAKVIFACMMAGLDRRYLPRGPLYREQFGRLKKGGGRLIGRTDQPHLSGPI